MVNLEAFHGTDNKSARNICINGINPPKGKTWFNDLGNGFYCYIDGDNDLLSPAIINAKRYAKTYKSKKGTPRVLKLDISVLESKILNLTNDTTLHSFQLLLKEVTSLAFQEYQDRLKTKSGAAKRNNRDGFKIEYVINHELIQEPSVIIMDTHTDFDHIRSNFNNGREMVIRDSSVVNNISLLL